MTSFFIIFDTSQDTLNNKTNVCPPKSIFVNLRYISIIVTPSYFGENRLPFEVRNSLNILSKLIFVIKSTINWTTNALT